MDKRYYATAFVSVLALAFIPSSFATVGSGTASLSQTVAVSIDKIAVRGRAVARRPARVNRNVRVNRGVVRPGWHGSGTRWVRPAHYWWRPGTAIAVGAAIGYVAASAAVAWAGPPPANNYCWYYTDPSRTRGFWDVCP